MKFIEYKCLESLLNMGEYLIAVNESTSSMASTIDQNYKPKGSKNLNSFKKVTVTQQFLKSHKGETPMLRHLRASDNMNTSIAWMNNDNIVGYISVSDPSKGPSNSDKWNGYIWLTAIEVAPQYKGYGLGDQLLKYAMNNLKANALGVNRKNQVAIQMYKKHGFKIPNNAPTNSTNILMYLHPENKSTNKNQVPTVTAETHDSINPNDSVSNKAVDIIFYNENKNKIGTASASAIDTKNGFLYNVEVFKKYRGMGYGSAIVSYMLKHYAISELTVEKTNSIAIRLYKKFGFKPYQEFKENNKDMIDMQRK